MLSMATLNTYEITYTTDEIYIINCILLQESQLSTQLME